MTENELPKDEGQETPAGWQDDPPPDEPRLIPVAYAPESADETARQSGMAMSAGIVFFGSVVFMLFLGWIADVLLGTSPWGIVVGIVFGSIIGFIQFFRTSSKIFSSKRPGSEIRSLMSKHDDDDEE